MPESQTWSPNGIVRIDPGDAAEESRAVDDPCELDDAQLSSQDVLLPQACPRFVLKHQEDPSVSARLQELADTLGDLAEDAERYFTTGHN